MQSWKLVHKEVVESSSSSTEGKWLGLAEVCICPLVLLWRRISWAHLTMNPWGSITHLGESQLPRDIAHVTPGQPEHPQTAMGASPHTELGGGGLLQLDLRGLRLEHTSWTLKRLCEKTATFCWHDNTNVDFFLLMSSYGYKFDISLWHLFFLLLFFPPWSTCSPALINFEDYTKDVEHTRAKITHSLCMLPCAACSSQKFTVKALMEIEDMSLGLDIGFLP